MTQQPNQPPKMDYSETEEFFSDIVGTHINPWSVSISFGLRATSPDEAHKMTSRIRMPLQQAKVLSLLLLRGLRRYEEQSDLTIDLPRQIIQELGIPLEDWQRF